MSIPKNFIMSNASVSTEFDDVLFQKWNVPFKRDDINFYIEGNGWSSNKYFTP